MALAKFQISKHTLAASYIREYPRATAHDQETELQLAVKEYRPLEKARQGQEQITVIGAHANGFPKELYEPLWDDLYDRLKDKNVYISSIWIADCSHQGDSGVLNESELGNDPSWLDHSRDMFLMINHFHKRMQRPLVGIGHSMGACCLVNLALMHPRLLTTLVLIDPVIQRRAEPGGNFAPAKASTKRRDRWPSRKDAEAAFKRSKFYQLWDPRVLNKWVEHGLRELPTFLHPEMNTSSATLPVVSADPSTAAVMPAHNIEREVTLKTTKHQEVFTFLRPNFPTSTFPTPDTHSDPTTHPDVDLSTAPVTPFYRPESPATFAKLPFVRPSVFYIFGDESALSQPVHMADKLARTGIGPGGSGGVAADRVRSHTFHGVGHLVPMEIVPETANACTSWLGPEVARWRALEDAETAAWAAVPDEEKSRLSEEYVTTIGSDGILGGERSKL